MDKLRMFLFVIFFCVMFFSGLSFVNVAVGEERPADGTAETSGGPQGIAPAAKQDEFGTLQNSLDDSRQKSYLGALRTLNSNLRQKYDALAGNYIARRTNYTKINNNTQRGKVTPSFILDNVDKLETSIGELEKKKEGLHSEALLSYDGGLPEGLSREWEKEEKEYRDYLEAIYRKVGWWQGLEYSPLWRKNESLYWDNIQNYHRNRRSESDEFKRH